MAKFRMYVQTNKVGSTTEDIVEVDDEDLEGLDENERAKLLDEMWQEWIWNGNIDGGYEEIK
ncbi:DUF7167 family protein [Paenibacillus sp. FSL L8-0709]|uniref:DUF7167 family protein n=1 Tax=Paenibacillus sp. FSL L8-0709 TaxID=2975312 RepID=UPI0030F887B6